MGNVKSGLLLLVLGCVVTTCCSGCVSNLFPGGPSVAGIVYTDVTDPAQKLSVATDSSIVATKQGRASNCAVLGLFAWGDGGLDAAMKDSGITKVHHVDHRVFLLLDGIWLQATTIVYGN